MNVIIIRFAEKIKSHIYLATRGILKKFYNTSIRKVDCTVSNLFYKCELLSVLWKDAQATNLITGPVKS